MKSRIHIFNNEIILLEMLNLRREGGKGSSFAALGRKYKIDHTSVMYQCRKYGIKPFQEPFEIKLEIHRRTNMIYDERPEEIPKSPHEGLVCEIINNGKRTYKDYLREAWGRGECLNKQPKVKATH